jgi:hypothetical protein
MSQKNWPTLDKCRGNEFTPIGAIFDNRELEYPAFLNTHAERINQ